MTALAALFVLCVPAIAQDNLARQEMVVIDLTDDGIDGPEFVTTLNAYVSDVGVAVKLLEAEKPPADHDAWVALASEVAGQRGSIPVRWFEPDREAEGIYNIYLVLLESSSGAVIVIPIELGMRRGNEMFRVLAATTRMVLDTEILDDLKKVVRTSQENPTPEPWPIEPDPGEPVDPEQAPIEPVKRSATLNLGYTGDLGFGGPSVLHGGRMGGLFHLNNWASVAVDVAYLAGSRETTLDIRTREQRLPLRLGAGASLWVGDTEATFLIFWSVEMLWASVEPASRDSQASGLDNIVRGDTGGGLEIRWGVPVWKRMRIFVAMSGQGMVVSHSYKRMDATAVHPSYFRLAWSVGMEIAGL